MSTTFGSFMPDASDARGLAGEAPAACGDGARG